MQKYAKMFHQRINPSAGLYSKQMQILGKKWHLVFTNSNVEKLYKDFLKNKIRVYENLRNNMFKMSAKA